MVKSTNPENLTVLWIFLSFQESNVLVSCGAADVADPRRFGHIELSSLVSGMVSKKSGKNIIGYYPNFCYSLIYHLPFLLLHDKLRVTNLTGCDIMKINTRNLPYEEVLKLPRLKHRDPRKPSRFLATVVRIASMPTLLKTKFTYTTERMELVGRSPA